MKKCIYVAGAILSAFLLTGCLKDFGNSMSGAKGFATIVSVEEGANTLFQTDVDGNAYIFSNDINAKTDLKKGDRFFISYMTLDLDNQPANAKGSKTNPFRFDGMTFEKINLFESEFMNEDHTEAYQDTLISIINPIFGFANVNDTYNKGSYYLSFAGGVPGGSKPEFDLVYDYTKNNGDTVYYEFRVKYTEHGITEKPESFINSFRINNPINEKGVIVVNYYSEVYSPNQYLWSAITTRCIMNKNQTVISYNNSSK